jgi:hypothetical protein
MSPSVVLGRAIDAYDRGMTSTPSPSPEAKRRKLFVLASEIGLTRDERLSLAQTLLWRDITTWKTLDDDQVNRLLDAMEGYVLTTHLILQRHP